MASRRCPSAMPQAASTHAPPSSGPRWPRVAVMASTWARSSGSEVAARRARNPLMPHIGNDLAVELGVAGHHRRQRVATGDTLTRELPEPPALGLAGMHELEECRRERRRV